MEKQNPHEAHLGEVNIRVETQLLLVGVDAVVLARHQRRLPGLRRFQRVDHLGQAEGVFVSLLQIGERIEAMQIKHVVRTGNAPHADEVFRGFGLAHRLHLFPLRLGIGERRVGFQLIVLEEEIFAGALGLSGFMLCHGHRGRAESESCKQKTESGC